MYDWRRKTFSIPKQWHSPTHVHTHTHSPLSPFSIPIQTLIHSTQGLQRQLSNQNKSSGTEVEWDRGRVRQKEREALWMCCQLAAADQWYGVKEAWNRKDPEWIKQLCRFYEVSDDDPELNVQLLSFSASSKFWSRIRLIETMRQLVQNRLQCVGCYIVPGHFLSVLIFPSLCSSFHSSLSFTGVIHYRLHSDTHKHASIHIHLAVREIQVCACVCFRGIMYSYDCLCMCVCL